MHDCFGLFWIVPLVPCEQEPSHFWISSCDLCNWFLQSLVFACFQVNVEVETAWNCHLKSKCVEMWDTDSLGSLGSPTPEVRPAENASPARSHAAALFFGSGVQQDGFGTGSGRVHCQVHRVLASLSLWLSYRLLGYSASVGPGALATRGATTRGTARPRGWHRCEGLEGLGGTWRNYNVERLEDVEKTWKALDIIGW